MKQRRPLASALQGDPMVCASMRLGMVCIASRLGVRSPMRQLQPLTKEITNGTSFIMSVRSSKKDEHPIFKREDGSSNLLGRGTVTQSVEYRPFKPSVVGSIPTCPTNTFFADVAQWQSIGFVNRRSGVRLSSSAHEFAPMRVLWFDSTTVS